MADPQIDELKELVRQNIALAQDTNHTLHKMRRGMWWGRIFSTIFWLIIVVGPVAVYYYYYQSLIQPYIQKAEQLYAQMEQGNQQLQSYQAQFSNFFGNSAPGQATSTK